jgi:predicted RNA binding protein YcfA (HicA-like mRNA interferase family)
MIEIDGWYVTKTEDSKRQYKHKTREGLVTIAGKLSDELASGTLSSILKQAGLIHEIFNCN